MRSSDSIVKMKFQFRPRIFPIHSRCATFVQKRE
jgi:hypothetical protein